MAPGNNEIQTWCANMGGHLVFGSIVGSDSYYRCPPVIAYLAQNDFVPGKKNVTDGVLRLLCVARVSWLHTKGRVLC